MNNLIYTPIPSYTNFCDFSVGLKIKDDGLRHYFLEQSNANDFANWVNHRFPAQQAVVQSKFSLLYNSALYYVFISKTQFDSFAGTHAYSNLLSEKDIDRAHAAIFKNIADVNTWRKTLTQDAFKNEFNQRRLLDRSRRHNSKNLLLRLLLKNSSALLPTVIQLFTQTEAEIPNGAISATFGKIYVEFLDGLMHEKINIQYHELKALYKTLSTKVIAKTVTQQSKDGNNILDLLILSCRQSQFPYLQIIVESAPAESLSAAIVQCHTQGNNPVHRVQHLMHRLHGHFMHRLHGLEPDLHSLFLLFEKVSKEAMGKAFLQTNIQGLSPLKAFISNKEPLLRLLKCFTDKDLIQILLLPAYAGENKTYLEIILDREHTSNIEELFNKAVINSVFEKIPNLDILCGIIYRKKFDLAASIIRLLEVETLSKFLQNASHEHYKNKFMDFLQSIDDLELIEYVFMSAPGICFEYYAEYWLEGFELKRELAFIAEKCINEKKDLNPVEAAYKEYIIRENTESYVKTYSSIKNGKSEIIDLSWFNSHEVAKNVFENGLESYLDLHILNAKIHKTIKHSSFYDQFTIMLAFIIDCLRKDNLIFTGAQISYSQFLTFPGVKEQIAVFVDIYSCIHHQQALVKIIKKEHSDDYIKQLSDYSYRPDLRIPRIKEEHCTHKYLHNEDKIIPYNSHKGIKKDKVYKSLKKQSYSILGKQLQIPVFGEHDRNRMLVGLMFNRQQCLPAKALFRHDYGTVARKWVGTEESVSEYAEQVKGVRLDNWEALVEHVEINPTQMPEVLARITRESLKTVIIARDTPEARRYAKELQQKCQHIGLYIATIFYHRKTQYISLYTEQSLLAIATASLIGSGKIKSSLQSAGLFANPSIMTSTNNPTSSSSMPRLG
ncbi:MAG: hypothetical protein V4501_01490 [Pseudomonadota bacterium]